MHHVILERRHDAVVIGLADRVTLGIVVACLDVGVFLVCLRRRRPNAVHQVVSHFDGIAHRVGRYNQIPSRPVVGERGAAVGVFDANRASKIVVDISRRVATSVGHRLRQPLGGVRVQLGC